MEAADDEAIAVRVKQRESKALVAAGVLERVEANHAHAPERPPAVGLQYRGAGRQLIQLGGDRIDLVEVGVEDAFEAAASLASGDPDDPVIEATDAPGLDDDDEEEDEDGECERADDEADIRFDERVEIDWRAPPAGSAGV